MIQLIAKQSILSPRWTAGKVHQIASVCSLEAMIEAGWELYDHLHSLGESVKDSKTMAGFGNYGIANMKAVAEERARFATLTTTYVHQAAGYIGMELMNKTTVHLQLQLGKRGANQRQHVPDHESLHTEVDDLTSLVYVRSFFSLAYP